MTEYVICKTVYVTFHQIIHPSQLLLDMKWNNLSVIIVYLLKKNVTCDAISDCNLLIRDNFVINFAEHVQV